MLKNISKKIFSLLLCLMITMIFGSSEVYAGSINTLSFSSSASISELSSVDGMTVKAMPLALYGQGSVGGTGAGQGSVGGAVSGAVSGAGAAYGAGAGAAATCAFATLNACLAVVPDPILCVAVAIGGGKYCYNAVSGSGSSNTNNCPYATSAQCYNACNNDSTCRACVVENGCLVKQAKQTCAGVVYNTKDDCENKNPGWTCSVCNGNLKYYPVSKSSPNPGNYSYNTTGNVGYYDKCSTLPKVEPKKIYKITFDLNGGQWIDGNTSNRVRYVPQNLSVGNSGGSKGTDKGNDGAHEAYPIKEDYKFKEWQFNGEKFDFATIPTSDITLTAVYEKLTDEDKRYECPDSEYNVYEPTEKLCYKVFVPDPDNADESKRTYNYTSYEYANGATFCYAYSTNSNCSQSGVVAYRVDIPNSGKPEHTYGKNNVTYEGYPKQDSWISKDTCKIGTECSEGEGIDRPSCEVRWDAIIYDTKDAELGVVFDDKEEKNIVINVNTSIISNVKAGTSFDKVINNNISTSRTVKAVNRNNDTISNTKSIIKTGDKIKVGTVYYTVSVKGDVTGTGTVGMGDVMKIAKLLNNDITEMSAESRQAADVTGDNFIEMNDAMKIAKHIVDKIEL